MSKPGPATLTRFDQLALLEVATDRPREALLVSLGTGLRLAELVGLDVGDAYLPGGQPRVRVRLRPEIAKRGRAGDVFLPDGLKPKLERFWSYKQAQGEWLGPGAPLLCSQTGRRLSKRRVQVLFRELQVEAGFDRLYPFHALRHTAITNVYRASKDLFLAQRFARHASPLTTVIYTHASDEDLREGVRGLAC
jgi:integrase/recombinase XerC